MRRFLPVSIIILFFFLLSPLVILAQEQSESTNNTTTGNITVQAKPAGGIFDWLINLFKKNNTGDIELVAKSSLPDLSFVPVQSGQLENNNAQTQSAQGAQDIDKVVSYYAVKNSTVRPEKDPRKSVTSNIADFFRNLFGGRNPTTEETVKLGNQQAGEYAAANFPAAIASTFQGETTQNLDQAKTHAMNTDETKILGTESDARMAYSLLVRQCSLLPAGVGEDLGCPVLSASNLYGEENPWGGPTQIPAETTPVPEVTSVPVSGSCEEGTGYCSVDYLHKPELFSDINAARIASMICQRESGGDAAVVNDGCLSGKSRDYSVGLFQINLLAHLGTLIKEGIIAQDCQGIIADEWKTNNRCTTPDRVRLAECIRPLKDPETNIKYARELSGGGTDWGPWSTAKGCNLTVPPAPVTTGELVRVPDTDLYLQNFNEGSITPSQIVIHWSGGWSSARATADWLRYGVVQKLGYPLACHLATDQNVQLQLLKYLPDSSQRAWCVGGDDNNTALNNEITGAYFDEVVDNPSHPRYRELMKETDKAVASTCWMLNYYHISKTRVFGHFETAGGKADGKPDPGPVFMQYFRQRVNTECP